MKSWLKRASVKEAAKSQYLRKFRHGAVVEVGGAIMATGCNGAKPKHHGSSPYSTHAEIDAIMRLSPELLTKAKLYVARLGAMGQITNSMPCQRCQKTLRSMGIKTVYYSIDGLHNWGQLDLQ